MQDLTIDQAGFDYTSLHTYSGYLIDNEKLLKSASGGAVSAIAEAILKNGGVVFGAVYSKDFKRSEYKCVSIVEDFEALKGSKYCDTAKEIVEDGEVKNVFLVLKEKLEEGKLVLFIGLGCDVGAAWAFWRNQKVNTDKLYTIDILCHGPTTAEVHRQFIEGLENRYHSKIKSFTVRYKEEGWTPPYIHAEFENGKVYSVPFYESDYGLAFSVYSKPGCYKCKFRGANHKSDITCGDFWGLTDCMSGWNNNGVSIMFVRTQRGEKLIDMIDKDEFHIEEADTAFALENNRMYYTCRPQDPDYDKFGKDLSDKGLHYAVAHFPVSKKQKIKRTLKRMLPKQAIHAMKALKSKLK